MTLYFDESGQTGCIIPNKAGMLFDEKQRFFVLGGVICNDKQDEDYLRRKYHAFKMRHGIDGEIKGSDMMKRDNNSLLMDFIDTMLDSEHFYLCCYDKLFYIATLINAYFYPRQLMNDDPVFYFSQASALAHEDIALFLKYCECCAIGTDEASFEFCRYIISFDFQKIDAAQNGYIQMAKLVLEGGEALDFPLPFGSYLDPDFTNIINITALGETALAIEVKRGIPSSEIRIVHDNITEFEKEFLDSFRAEPISLQFKDSKSDELLQYADNVASVFRKCCTETVNLFLRGQQWDPDKSWFPTLYAKLLSKIKYENIKWDVSISDQVLPLCIEEMFSEECPVVLRNNTHFYKRFMWHRTWVINNIASLNYDVSF